MLPLCWANRTASTSFNVHMHTFDWSGAPCAIPVIFTCTACEFMIGFQIAYCHYVFLFFYLNDFRLTVKIIKLWLDSVAIVICFTVAASPCNIHSVWTFLTAKPYWLYIATCSSVAWPNPTHRHQSEMWDWPTRCMHIAHTLDFVLHAHFIIIRDSTN